MKPLNAMVILCCLVMIVIAVYELHTGYAIRQPGPFISRATQPLAYWWYVSFKLFFALVGVIILIKDRNKS